VHDIDEEGGAVREADLVPCVGAGERVGVRDVVVAADESGGETGGVAEDFEEEGAVAADPAFAVVEESA
jgi:hypothetical protein